MLTLLGKTTLAKTITERLNEKASSTIPIAKFVPMDGYHLTRAQLSSMPDPQHAHDRRGAEFTFDGLAFLRLVQRVRQPFPKDSFYAPSFDHAIKDPVAGDICIAVTDRVVVFEGNYLSLNKMPWSEAAGLMDELWFVEVDFEVAGKRLVERRVKLLPCPYVKLTPNVGMLVVALLPMRLVLGSE